VEKATGAFTGERSLMPVKREWEGRDGEEDPRWSLKTCQDVGDSCSLRCSSGFSTPHRNEHGVVSLLCSVTDLEQ
jgi:hypothetical protein